MKDKKHEFSLQVKIPAELHRQLKICAINELRSVKRIVIELITKHVKEHGVK